LQSYNGQKFLPGIKKGVLEMIDANSHMLFIFLSADLAKEGKKPRPQAESKITYKAIRLRRKLMP